MIARAFSSEVDAASHEENGQIKIESPVPM